MQDDLVAECEFHGLRLNDFLARRLRGCQLHLRVAAQFAALRAFAPQRLQLAHAAFVARAPRLDALAYPHFLLRELLVEQRVGLRLRMQAFFAPAQIIFVVARPRRELAAIDLDDARGERAQEAAIVRDEDEAERCAAQKFLEPRDRRDVEVIGRLVEQQHVGRAHQRLSQQYAALHAAGLRGEVGVGGQFQTLQHLADTAIQIPAVLCLDLSLHGAERGQVALGDGVMVAREQSAELAESLRDDVEHAAARVLRYFLRELGHAHAALRAHLAIVGLDLAGEQAQQRRFAFAVAADDADALARLDRQIDVFEQKRAADAVVDALELDQGHARIVTVKTKRAASCGPFRCALE